MKNNQLCPQYRHDDLVGLAAGDLPRWRTARLRRHISNCAICTAAINDIAQVFSLSTQVTALPGTGLQSHIWSAIQATAPIAVHRRRPALAFSLAAGAVCAAVAGTVFLAPGAPMRPMPVFAEVARVMQSVNTLQYDVYIQEEHGGKLGPSRLSSRETFRLNPPAATIESMTRPNGSLIHLTPKASFYRSGHDFAGNPSYFVNPSRNSADVTAYIKGSMTFDQNGTRYNTKFGRWKLAQKTTLNGAPALRFDRDRGRIMLDGTLKRNGWTQSVWVDPATLRLLKDEMHIVNDRTHVGSVSTQTNFVYDAPKYDLLDFEPPVGQHITLSNYYRIRSTPAEQREATQVTQAAIDAWGKGDWIAFSAQCDGGAPPWKLPTVATGGPAAPDSADVWQARIHDRRDLPARRVYYVCRCAIYDYIRNSPHDSMPADLPTNAFIVQTPNATFFLKRLADGKMRIFCWQSETRAEVAQGHLVPTP